MSKIIFAVASYDFEGTRADTLPFKKDDIITVLKMDGGGWWSGASLDGRIGIFPKAFVEINEGRDSYDCLLYTSDAADD